MSEPSPASAATPASLPPLIPREVLFGNPERTNPQISPDGRYLAYIAPDDRNVLQVWLRTVGQQDDRVLTADRKRGIRACFWAYDGGQLIYAQDSDGDENWHLYAVGIRTNVVRDLTLFQGIQAQMVALDPRHPDEALVAMNLSDRRKHDVYRVNLRSGAVELDTENPGNVLGWKADAELRVRAAAASTPDGGTDLVGDPDADEEFLKSRSPLFFVDRIKAPLLIGQGANDPRVKQTESDQIVEALRKAGKPVEYVVYADEGHGFARPENRLHFFALAEEFLAKHLGGRFEPMGEMKGHSGEIR